MQADEMVTVTARVTREERDALARVARRYDRTASREVRRAVRHYLADPHAADALTPLGEGRAGKS